MPWHRVVFLSGQQSGEADKSGSAANRLGLRAPTHFVDFEPSRLCEVVLLSVDGVACMGKSVKWILFNVLEQRT